jgi:hypothetical protein
MKILLLVASLGLLKLNTPGGAKVRFGHAPAPVDHPLFKEVK